MLTDMNENTPTASQLYAIDHARGVVKFYNWVTLDNTEAFQLPLLDIQDVVNDANIVQMYSWFRMSVRGVCQGNSYLTEKEQQGTGTENVRCIILPTKGKHNINMHCTPAILAQLCLHVRRRQVTLQHEIEQILTDLIPALLKRNIPHVGDLYLRWWYCVNQVVSIATTLAQLETLISTETSSLTFRVNSASTGVFQPLLDKLSSDKDTKSLAEKYQIGLRSIYEQSSLSAWKRIHQQFDDMHAAIRSNPAVDTGDAYTITLYHATKKRKNEPTTTNLKLLYPNLQMDLKVLRAWSNRTKYIDAHYTKLMGIKTSLMFIGFPESKVDKLLQTCYDAPLITCQITGAKLPASLVVPVKMADERVIYVSRFYVNSHSQRFMQDGGGWHEYMCREAREYHHAYVLNYNFNVTKLLTPKWLSTENVMVYNKGKHYNPTPFLGVELEVERTANADADVIKRVRDSLGHDFVATLHDGSLTGGHLPFEIVTAPATLAAHRERWQGFLNNFPLKSQLKSYKTENCGMHVHISRNSFNGLHLAKFLRFINDNDNRRFVCKLAGRSANRYAEYRQNSIMGFANTMSSNQDRNKYTAVNVKNSGTIEVRVFKGNLATIGFLKNLEFVHAVWAYTKDASMQNLNYKDFLYWLFDSANDTKEYKHLQLWLIKAGFNVSNFNISKDTPEVERNRLIHKRNKIKKVRAIMTRKFANTKLADEEVLEAA